MKEERKSIIGAEWDRQAGVITFSVAGVGTMQLVLGKCGTELAQTAAYHGYEQKVRDAAAIPRDTKTGRSATPQEKYDSMARVIEALHAGVWNVARQAQRALNRAALFQAIAQVRGFEASAVEAKFRDRTDDVLRAFLTHKEIAGRYAELTAQDSGQADALLSELDAGE